MAFGYPRFLDFSWFVYAGFCRVELNISERSAQTTLGDEWPDVCPTHEVGNESGSFPDVLETISLDKL
tara:strand:- start:116 stop:319 length:204 start_codon:yes stop_codon:yes gene_type:complete